MIQDKLIHLEWAIHDHNFNLAIKTGDELIDLCERYISPPSPAHLEPLRKIPRRLQAIMEGLEKFSDEIDAGFNELFDTITNDHLLLVRSTLWLATHHPRSHLYVERYKNEIEKRFKPELLTDLSKPVFKEGIKKIELARALAVRGDYRAATHILVDAIKKIQYCYDIATTLVKKREEKIKVREGALSSPGNLGVRKVRHKKAATTMRKALYMPAPSKVARKWKKS